MNGSKYLAFDSFADANKSRDDFLYDATIRFVEKFASYKASVDYNQVVGYLPLTNPLGTAVSAVSQSVINLANWTSVS